MIEIRRRRGKDAELWIEGKPLLDGTTGGVATFSEVDVYRCINGIESTLGRVLTALTGAMRVVGSTSHKTSRT